MAFPTAVEIVMFACLGLLGGLINILVDPLLKDYKELKEFSKIRVALLGMLTGIVFSIAHSEWSIPNSVMSIVAGYAGSDFMDSLIERAKR